MNQCNLIKNGVIVSYTNPLPIDAQENRTCYFPGFTRESGKTITVLYDNGDEVTYGFVGEVFQITLYDCEKRGHAGADGRGGNLS